MAVLHADRREDAGHRLGADPTVDGRDCAVATLRCPRVVVTGARAAGEKARTRELLHADRETHVALARLHRHDRRAERGGTGGTRVGDVVDGDPGLADLLL